MGNVRWKANEIEFLKENYGVLELEEIEKILNKTRSSIIHKAIREKIPSQRKWTYEEIEYLKNNYKDKTYKEMTKDLNRSKAAIDIKINRLGLVKSNYNYDYSFFNVIDTEEKAYWLGFISADGNVWINEETQSCEVCIKLQASDFEHLKKFNKTIHGNLQVTFDERICSFTGKPHKCCNIRLYCKEMAYDLIKHNVIPNKSLVIKYLNTLPKELERNYIRGYFDGNGCLSISKVNENNFRCDFTSGSKDYILGLKNALENEGFDSYIYECKDKHCYRLNINGGKKGCLKFLDYMYKDSTIYLDRKFNRYKKVKQLNNIK